jgi:hypothetical protein
VVDSQQSADVVVPEFWFDVVSKARGEPGTTPCGTECGESESEDAVYELSSGSVVDAGRSIPGTTPCGTDTDTVCCGESEDEDAVPRSSSSSVAVTILTLVWVYLGFDNLVLAVVDASS